MPSENDHDNYHDLRPAKEAMTRRLPRTPGRRWAAFARDTVIVLAIGVGVSLLSGGKYDTGPWDGPTAWLIRYVVWAFALVVGVVIGSRHLKASRPSRGGR
jgi:fatty acid desaturase